ncbi:MAG: beta-ketoacyl-ACP synthase III [Thermodesulfobacteriota bacterium]|jgi:3-oxoacyl-[acyl-carrier-protein] synthase-3
MPNEVYITRLAKFMPNRPVTNDDMEKYLGLVNGRPSKAKAIVLRNNQIKTRYYALDENGCLTHTNAQMTAEAVRGLFDDRFTVDDIKLLSCGTSSQDQLMPSHASMVHGELGGKPIEINSPTGACICGMQAMKYAYLAVLSGEKDNAVCTGSELMSTYMRARNFEKETEKLALLEQQPIVAFEKDFLRWMLSDGAGAALLQNKPNQKGLSLRIDWIEIASFANQFETCMYAGGEKLGNGEIKGWREFEANELLERSILSVRQDIKMLDTYGVRQNNLFLKGIVKKRDLDLDKISFFLPHLSSEYFRSRLDAGSRDQGVYIPQEKWFTNLTRLGNIGSAAVYCMLEELLHSDKLKKGQKILTLVPESARFSYAYTLLTAI